jgi:hypothetical protein
MASRYRDLPAALITGLTLAGCTDSRVASGPEPLPAATLTVRDSGFATPESIHHDAVQDLYFVSNINGGPADADGNGFISRVSPEGFVELKWIDGATPGVTLHAPKGLATAGDFLFVTDLNTLRWFNRSTGEPVGQLEVAGATFLNDVVAHQDGSIYFSDSGLRAGAAGLEPNGTDAIYRLNPDASLDTVAMSPELGQPNGLALSGDTLYVVSFGSGEFYRMEGGARANVIKLPKGGLDGLAIRDGLVFISSWEGQSIFRGFLDGELWEAFSGVPAPADIGHDVFRHRLLIPLFMDNELKFVPLLF